MKIYFIAICGKGVGNLAIFLKRQGHDVKGSEMSENTFYPPIADMIVDSEIPVDFGFDPEKITEDIDLVIIGGGALIHDPNNPQIAKAKKLGLEVISYAAGIGRFITKEENIEVVGNHGKTTTTSLIAWCLKACKEDASYFIGEAPLGFDTSIYSGESKWSVAEGDEHPTLGIEPGGKFLYHNPKHILFTSADWDHKNIYKTEDEYIKTFLDLFKIQPKDGQIVACLDGINIINILTQTSSENKINLYTIGVYKESQNQIDVSVIETNLNDRLNEIKILSPKLYERLDELYYMAEVDYKWKPESTRFLIKKINVQTREEDKVGYFETSLIGQIGLENSLATISTLLTFNFDIEGIKEGISTFQGARRRLQLVHNRDYKVINDYAHSPIKIKSSVKSIRTKYQDNRIFVLFHVSQSGLKEDKTFQQLKSVFNLADFVIIPKVYADPNAETPLTGKDYRDLIRQGAVEGDDYLKANNVFYAPLNVQVQSILENNLRQNDIIVIMSSGDSNELVELSKGLHPHSIR